MSILVLSEIFPPRTGGSGRWLWEIYRRLSAEVVFAAGQTPGDVEFDRTHGERIYRLPLTFDTWGVTSANGRQAYWRAYRELTAMVTEHRITSIHAGRNLPEGLLAWALCQRWRIPYTCFVHGEELNTAHKSRELAFLTRRVFAGARVLIANSENTANLLQGWVKRVEKIEMLPPGVDTDYFCPAARDDAVRQRLGWGQRRVILTVGRLQKRKGHDHLIKALPGLIAEFPDLLYAVAGNGVQVKPLRQLVEQLRLSEYVQFMGEIDDADLLACYQQCELFALPNREVDGDFEGFGMVLIEAQSCGIPVIAGNSGGTRETLKEGVTGCLVDCTDPTQIAAAIRRQFAMAQDRSIQALAAREWATRQFSWKSLAPRTESVLAFHGVSDRNTQGSPKKL